jgi:hypothetical protein
MMISEFCNRLITEFIIRPSVAVPALLKTLQDLNQIIFHFIRVLTYCHFLMKLDLQQVHAFWVHVCNYQLLEASKLSSW